jgi:hypothetical protein
MRTVKYLAKNFAYMALAAWGLMILFGNMYHANPQGSQPISYVVAFQLVLVIMVISTFLDYVKRARTEHSGGSKEIEEIFNKIAE